MSNEEKEIIAIYAQIIVSAISVIEIIVSILLLYNEKLEIKGEKTLFNAEQTQKISVFNRTFILVTAIIFLIINYALYKISKEQGENLKPYELQIVASYLTIIVAIITLYIVLNPTNEGQVVDVENPII
mgnify:FL=1